MDCRSRSACLSALLLLSTTACATTGVSSRDPFAGSSSRGGGNRPAVRVGLEVVCDQCLITFTAGSERGSTRAAQADQVWSYRFVRYPVGQEAVELCAHDTAAEGRLSRVRIFVNGDVAASEANDPASPSAMLCASTSIPVRPEPGDSRTGEGAAGPRA